MMSMTKQELQDRIVSISNEMAQLKANYAKLEGHMGESQHWLTEILKREAEEQVKEFSGQTPGLPDQPQTH